MLAFTCDGETVKYQKLRNVTVGGQAADWVEPKVPLPRLGPLDLRPVVAFLAAGDLLVPARAVGDRRHDPRRFVAVRPILIPILLQTGCLSLVAFTQEFRFQFPVYMIALLYSGYFLFCTPRRDATPASLPGR